MARGEFPGVGERHRLVVGNLDCHRRADLLDSRPLKSPRFCTVRGIELPPCAAVPGVDRPTFAGPCYGIGQFWWLLIIGMGGDVYRGSPGAADPVRRVSVGVDPWTGVGGRMNSQGRRNALRTRNRALIGVPARRVATRSSLRSACPATTGAVCARTFSIARFRRTGPNSFPGYT